MKATIKRLSRAIDKVLDDNIRANYYNNLIDGGEWAQQAPNFKCLICQFDLTREKLNSYLDYAEQMARKFHEHYPHPMPASWERQINPWEIVIQNLHSIFMAEAYEGEPILK